MVKHFFGIGGYHEGAKDKEDHQDAKDSKKTNGQFNNMTLNWTAPGLALPWLVSGDMA